MASVPAAEATGAAPVVPEGQPPSAAPGLGPVAGAASSSNETLGPAAGATAVAGAAGTSAATENTGAAGQSAAAGAAATTDSHGHGTHADHCVDGFAPDPADALLPNSEPTEWVSDRGEVDLFLPEPVLAWMHKNKWMEAHDAWHNVRRCGSFVLFPDSPTVNICDEKPELVAKFQECSGPDDGYAFLVEHRHMIHGFEQAFPQHKDLFDSFERFPFEAKDVPEQWRDRFGTGWSAEIVQVAQTLDDIENHLDMFPTEGHLGAFMQCGGVDTRAFQTSVHIAMHSKWSISTSPYALVDQVVDLGNYMFWKLHGWIDDVWERYRVAKGLAPDEPKLTQALLDNCREMDRLSALFDATLGGPTRAMGGTMEPEYGVFHTTVRPILNESCSGCHSGTAPVGGISFARDLTSRAIVSQLVDVAAKGGGTFKRIVAGSPEQSWLYLKVTNMAKDANCTGTCNVQNMPPTGQVELNATQLAAIRDWIAGGAVAPTTTP